MTFVNKLFPRNGHAMLFAGWNGRQDQINFYFQWLVKKAKKTAPYVRLLSDLRDQANLFARCGWQSAQHVVSLLVAWSVVWTQLVTWTSSAVKNEVLNVHGARDSEAANREWHGWSRGCLPVAVYGFLMNCEMIGLLQALSAPCHRSYATWIWAITIRSNRINKSSVRNVYRTTAESAASRWRGRHLCRLPSPNNYRAAFRCIWNGPSSPICLTRRCPRRPTSAGVLSSRAVTSASRRLDSTSSWISISSRIP